MFLVVTGVFIYLFFVSRQERKTLEQKAIAIRTALVKGELAGPMETTHEMPMRFLDRKYWLILSYVD